MRKIKLVLLCFLTFISLNFVSSEVCCFYPSNGMCSERVPSNVCTDNGGTVVGSSCSSSAECSFGCCVLGLGVKYNNRRQCELEALSGGFQVDWRQISEKECSGLVSSKVMGACVYNYDFCSYTKKENCQGIDRTFHEGKLCTDISLKTRCNKTEKTKCFEDGNVYYVDSCGNRDALVQECKYSEGFLCVQNGSRKAYCKSLNCVDRWNNSRKNGESWCVGIDGKELLIDIRKETVKKVEETMGTVGSRFFKQICVDGEVITEPCADYRNEICVPKYKEKSKSKNKKGEDSSSDNSSIPQAKCIANPYGECLAAGNSSEDCNEEFCWMFKPYDCVNYKGEELCGDERNTYSSRWPGAPKSQISETVSTLMKELGLSICLAKVPGGQDISRSSVSLKGEGVCSLGNFNSGDVVFRKDTNPNTGIGSWFQWDTSEYWGLDIEDPYSNPEVNKTLTRYIALTSGKFGTYYDWEQIFRCKEEIDKKYCYIMWSNPKKIDLNPIVFAALNERCNGVGDCDGKTNWGGGSGSSPKGESSLVLTKDEGWRKYFAHDFKCSSWSPPSSGDCSKCGADGLPCSQYRCKSLGKNCEYKEPRGINTGVCVKSDDLSGPVITTSQNPANPIPPYSSVKITITTNEDSYCRFDFKSGGVNIDNMKYETDGKLARTHEFALTAPRAAIDDEDIQARPLLTRDGKYEVFIMCEDGAGNANQKIHVLEVMKTPDEIPPSILEFVPLSNSFVEFNKTTKRIRFKLNEPAECRWDFDNTKKYNDMGVLSYKDEQENEQRISLNQFVCDTSINEETTAKGYWCEGELRNITTTIGNSTKFYIKCKDQPWLEGKEDRYYKRNENQRAFEYVLRPSMALQIIDFVPQGEYIVGSDRQNLSIQLKTKDGVERGKAECQWKLRVGDIRSAWKNFNRTNSTTHTDTILNLIEGEYEISVRCEDIAGNKVNESYKLNVKVDKEPPKLLRVYNDKGSLKIVLDEKASCKYLIFSSCSFVANNGTSMDRIKDKEFKTSFRAGNIYYIRCEDVFGNSACYSNIFAN